MNKEDLKNILIHFYINPSITHCVKEDEREGLIENFRNIAKEIEAFLNKEKVLFIKTEPLEGMVKVIHSCIWNRADSLNKVGEVIYSTEYISAIRLLDDNTFNTWDCTKVYRNEDLVSIQVNQD